MGNFGMRLGIGLSISTGTGGSAPIDPPVALVAPEITAGPSLGNRVDAQFAINFPATWDGYDSLYAEWTLDGVHLADYIGNEYLLNDFAYHQHTVGYRETATNSTGSTSVDSNTYFPDLTPATSDVPVLPGNFSISHEGTSLIDLSALADFVWTNTSLGDTPGIFIAYDGEYFDIYHGGYSYDVSGHEGQVLTVAAQHVGTVGAGYSAFSNPCNILA